MKRREFLAVVGAGTVVVTAACVVKPKPEKLAMTQPDEGGAILMLAGDSLEIRFTSDCGRVDQVVSRLAAEGPCQFRVLNMTHHDVS